MDPSDFRAQLEYELLLRQGELAYLRNQFNFRLETDDESDNINCKVLIVMLYSNFQGFCKLALKSYIQSINGERITRSEAKEHIAAVSLADIFLDLENPDKAENKRCEFFKRAAKRHKFQRYYQHAYFICKIDDVLGEKLNISEKVSDDIVKTKSNLGPEVLQEILYRLGLSYNSFNKYNGTIRTLVYWRDIFAHGDTATGMNKRLYYDLENEIYAFMSDLMIFLTEAVQNKYYKKDQIVESGSAES